MPIQKIMRTLAASLAVAALSAMDTDTASAQVAMRYPVARSLQEPIPFANPVLAGEMMQPEAAPYSRQGVPVARPTGSGVARNRQGNVPSARSGMGGVAPTQLQGYRAGGTAAGSSAIRDGRVSQAGYVPSHLRVAQQVRTAQMISEVPLAGGTAPQTPAAQGSLPEILDEGMVYDDGTMIGESYVDPAGQGGCSSCGSSFAGCGTACDSCCERGGCPPGMLEDCWLSGFGLILQRADYFAGAQCWDSPMFPDSQRSDYNGGSGFYAGANLGVPLCRITCGLLSGQLGVRAVQSEISGSPNISQLFATAGFFRRVDYGLQFGVVADYLKEDFLFEAEVMQIRGDLSWQYAGGNAFGFRFARGIQDDQVPEIIPGAGAAQFRLDTLDSYRFYGRNNCIAGGYADLSVGWTDSSQIVGGFDFDIPVSECVAVQSGVTYLLPTSSPANALGGNAFDGWNLYVGFAFRPQGRCYYQNYDRPILPVADNGSLVVRRGF